MGVISKNKRQITVYYHSGNSIGKQLYAYTMASQKKVLAIDISKTQVTGTQWAELASGLGIAIEDFIHIYHPDFITKHGKNRPVMEQHDWLKILQKDPLLLKYPVVIDGENYLQIKSAAAFKKYMEPDSAGIENEALTQPISDGNRH